MPVTTGGDQWPVGDRWLSPTRHRQGCPSGRRRGTRPHLAHGQQIIYVHGRTGHPAPSSCRGDGKTDAKAAFVIADQARMRRDLQPLQERDEIAVDLRILAARRYDLSAGRTRAINRLRAQLLEYFPALERAFDCIRLDDPHRKSLSPCDCEDAVGDRR